MSEFSLKDKLVYWFNQSAAPLYGMAEFAQSPQRCRDWVAGKLQTGISFMENYGTGALSTPLDLTRRLLRRIDDVDIFHQQTLYDLSSPFQKFLHGHLSGYFGAHAIVYAASMGTAIAASRAFADFKKLEMIYAPAAFAFLAAHEYRQMNNGKLDWADMVVYAVAIGAFVVLGKSRSQYAQDFIVNEMRKPNAPAQPSR